MGDATSDTKMLSGANYRQITSGGKERLSSSTTILAQIFATDPVITYMLSSLTPTQRASYMHKYMSSLLTAAALNDGIFDSISPTPTPNPTPSTTISSLSKDWQLISVLMPPGKRVDNPLTWFQSGLVHLLWKLGYAGFRKMILEYTGLSDAVKHKALASSERFYYVFFLGTREDCRGRGLCGEMIRYYQEVAGKEGLPIWLEATTPYSARQYERQGFEAVDRFSLGVGAVGADGLPKKGGEGVPVVGMIWRPKKDGGVD